MKDKKIERNKNITLNFWFRTKFKKKSINDNGPYKNDGTPRKVYK